MAEERTQTPFVELAAFEACDVNAPIAGVDQVSMPGISMAYGQASAAAASPAKDVYLLLSAVAGIHLRPPDPGNKFSPGVQRADLRTMLPSDIRGSQADVLESVLPKIRHPAMRARVADVVWTSDRRKAAVAEIAINAYCDCVEGLMSGSLKAFVPIDGRNLIDAQTPAHRALQISSATKKRKAAHSDRLVSALTGLYRQARQEAQPAIFSRLAQLCVDYDLIGKQPAAVDLEGVADANPTQVPHAVQMALDYASYLYGRTGDAESERRCQLGAVHQMLRMRDQCSQAGAKASWVMDALMRLRQIKCDEAAALEEELELQLRRLQRASMREMATFVVDISNPVERDRILDLFVPMDLSTALQSFALLAVSPKIEDLKAHARARAEHEPFSAMMGGKHVDDEGRTIVHTSDAGRGEPPEDWYLRMISQAESHRRADVVANSIDPVRCLIAQSIAIEERHFRPIVGVSPFVSRLQAPLYALGFARFFQGDFASAAYLLIPQLEASLRHILKARGADPSKRRDDATEEDRSLDAIIANHRSDLLEMMGEPLLDELNRIFNVQPGPTLRHDVAHGQLSEGECYSADVIYACWLLYRVCCLPLFTRWDEFVRPGLAIEEPGR
ncbi:MULTISPECIES: hypothetical protein [unclassified Bradyrhizobium]|uniref:DUF7380 domain-containing protein n=1 Tax=unclassified Bradyrhizobium TaxID=2631580 RepID=UPI0029160CA4|nr:MULTISPECIES: hypothetical protein [unclassified Bradyrhizobium]